MKWYETPAGAEEALAKTMRSVVMMLLLVLLASPLAAQAPGEDKMEAYLERLGLDDLRIVYLEQELARFRTDNRALLFANKLSDLYASQLLVVTDPKQVTDLRERIRALIKSYPQANTPTLQLLLLQGDYSRAEALAAQWIMEPESVFVRDEARQILQRIAPELSKHAERFLKDLTRVSAELDRLPEGKARALKEQEVNRVASMTGRANYFDAWTSYYLGLTAATPAEGAAAFKKARLNFQRVLGLDKQEGPPVDADSLALDYESRARGVLGLALVAMNLGDTKAGLAWFQLLRDPVVHHQVRDQVGYWQVWALLRADQPGAANDLAEKEIAAMSDAFTQGKLNLSMVLIRHGMAGTHSGADAVRQNLGWLGAQGLIRIRRFDLARQFIFKYSIGKGKQEGFAFRFIEAQNTLEQANRVGDRATYQKAAQQLQAALASADTAKEPLMTAESSYWIGLCHYHLGAFDQALAAFKQAALALKVLKSALAADAAWMAAVAALRQAEREPTQKAAALEALHAFRHDFPHHPLAKKAEFQLGRLSQDVQALEKVPPTAANYAQARLDLCRRYWENWQRDGQRPADAAHLQTALELYLALPQAEKNPPARLECLLVAVELALHAQPPDLKLARERLAKAATVLAGLSPRDPLHADYRYRQLLLARAAQELERAREQVMWLCANCKGTPYEEAALIVQAQMTEESLAKADGLKILSLRHEALVAYRQLVQVLGHSPHQLQTSKNALAASSRRATLAFDASEFQEAADELDRLLAAFPDDANFLRRAGIACQALGKHDQALKYFRPLVASLPASAADYFEVKFHYLTSLAKVNPGQARRAFEQLKKAAPELGGERWRAEFLKLEAALK